MEYLRQNLEFSFSGDSLPGQGNAAGRGAGPGTENPNPAGRSDTGALWHISCGDDLRPGWEISEICAGNSTYGCAGTRRIIVPLCVGWLRCRTETGGLPGVSSTEGISGSDRSPDGTGRECRKMAGTGGMAGAFARAKAEKDTAEGLLVSAPEPIPEEVSEAIEAPRVQAPLQEKTEDEGRI